jgi:hypothetical protein
MKKRISVILMAVVPAICFFSCQPKVDMAKEETAIKAVIEGEINASFNGEYDTWTTFFVHESNVIWMQATNEKFWYWKGWDEISSQMKNYVVPERKGTIKFEGNSDYLFRINGHSALVNFTARFISKGVLGVGCEVRALEKQQGVWKIVYLGTVYSSTYEAPAEKPEATQ